LLNITSNENIKLSEISEAANTIESIVDPDANIIWDRLLTLTSPPIKSKSPWWLRALATSARKPSCHCVKLLASPKNGQSLLNR
jgi:hypothetical protein